MRPEDVRAFQALPPSTGCRLIEFDKSEVRPGFVSKTYFLIVSGTKPWVTMRVQLVPLVYITKPDYWGIEVVGCQTGIGLPMTAPYTQALDITHFIGTKGIEVIGANRKQKHNVP
jgi:hypothetical protein